MSTVDEVEDKSLAAGHPCPKCGSTNVTRSQRRGIQEAVILKHEGLSPYRCRECDARFIQRSLHHRSRAHSWASSLGIPDGKRRRQIVRWAVTAVLVVVALVIAFILFGYFTRPAPAGRRGALPHPPARGWLAQGGVISRGSPRVIASSRLRRAMRPSGPGGGWSTWARVHVEATPARPSGPLLPVPPDGVREPVLERMEGLVAALPVEQRRFAEAAPPQMTGC